MAGGVTRKTKLLQGGSDLYAGKILTFPARPVNISFHWKNSDPICRMNDAPSRRKTPTPSKRPTEVDKSPRDKPYHHGSLPHALLDAAELVLRRDGIRGLTLRAIAREAGVSHTAPQHHFGDTAGVLSELAASGHRRLASSMADSAAGAEAGQARRKAIARGYVSFARTNPALLHLMSRGEMLDATRPSLMEARQASARALAGAFKEEDDDEASAHAENSSGAFDRMDAAQAIAMTAAWAYVHGLALLLIDGRLNALANSAEGILNAEALVDAAIEHVQVISSAPGKSKTRGG
jgi:AcrR family transcriptional regulator